MYWWLNPYYYPYYWYPLPYIMDPTYLLGMTFQWIIYPYYFMMTMEIYRAIIETWRRSLEALTKALEVREVKT